ncbi:hypothetical protein [uncultured Planktomarina sp.]|uniref:hypothetical protein n=1 Tax=uncultured Planktomarina sp. TaxID=1538529 RepID=UPI003261842D
MTSDTNEFGQEIGFPLDFTGPWLHPQSITLTGRTCHLKRAAPEHACGLFGSYSLDHSGKNWIYMPTSLAPEFAEFEVWFMSTCLGDDFLFYTVLDHDE